jgi:hypothetical protein
VQPFSVPPAGPLPRLDYGLTCWPACGSPWTTRDARGSTVIPVGKDLPGGRRPACSARRRRRPQSDLPGEEIPARSRPARSLERAEGPGRSAAEVFAAHA